MSELIYYNAAHPKIIEGFPSDFQKLCKLFPGVSILDRTETIPCPYAMKNMAPIPIGSTTATFADLSDKRALELIKLAEDRDCNIRVFWSGGIDSTLVLVSLLKNMTSYDRLIVHMNSASIDEYPLFFRKYILSKLKTEVADIRHVVYSNDITITGELGDQMFGSLMISTAYRFFGEESIIKPYKEFVPVFLQSYGFGSVFEYLEPLMAKSPYPIETFYDYFWWLNFAMKYQDVIMRFLVQSEITEQAVQQVIHFFDTQDFQLWSMCNPDKKYKDVYTSYKFTMKDYIYDFTGDTVYRDKKKKHASLPDIVHSKNNISFILDDLTVLPLDTDPKQFYAIQQ